MQIESLGYYQKIASTVSKSSTTQEKSSFTNFLQSVTTAVEETVNSSSTEVTATDLKDLLSFLSKEDILEVEEGLQLLDQLISNSNEDLLSMIENYFGISPIQLQTLLTNLTEKLGGGDNGGQSKLETLLQLVERMGTLPTNELAQALDKDSIKLIKAAKLYELLSKNQDSINEDASKIDFKTLSNKLTSILEGSSLKTSDQQVASRLSFLKQTFSSISTNPTLKDEQTSSTTGKSDMVSGSVQFLQMSRPEQLTLTLPTGSKQVQTEQLIKQFESILARSQFTNVNGVQRLFLQLNPNHLGSLRIEIVQQDSVMVAKIVTSTQAAKEAIEGQLNHLKQAFNAQNIQVERVEISQSQTGQERFLNRDGEQEQARQEQAEHKEEQKSDQDFNTSFEEALLNTEA